MSQEAQCDVNLAPWNAEAQPQLKLALRIRRNVRWGDRLFMWALRLPALGFVFLLALIATFLFVAALPAIHKFGLEFLTNTAWDPVREEFGVAPVIFGTLATSFLALLISVPLSVGTALFLSELAPRRLARPLGFLVEMLAAVPSIVYGLWGLFALAPWLRVSVQPWMIRVLGFLPFFRGPAYGVGMFTAGIILAIMITPTICSIAQEVFRAIPRSQREGVLALGGTRWEMLRLAVLRGAAPGLFGAVILGLGRALGETMAVTMVIGNRPAISASLFAPAQTMASVIANEYAEATSDVHLAALAEVGLLLFAVTFAVNGIARLIVRRGGPR